MTRLFAVGIEVGFGLNKFDAGVVGFVSEVSVVLGLKTGRAVVLKLLEVCGGAERSSFGVEPKMLDDRGFELPKTLLSTAGFAVTDEPGVAS